MYKVKVLHISDREPVEEVIQKFLDEVLNSHPNREVVSINYGISESEKILGRGIGTKYIYQTLIIIYKVVTE